MNSIWLLAGCIWGIALVLALPLLAAVWQDERRGLVTDGEGSTDESELPGI